MKKMVSLRESSSMPFEYKWQPFLNEQMPRDLLAVTVVSEMIKFLNKQVFRVGLKTSIERGDRGKFCYGPTTIYFAAANLNKLGLKVVHVTLSGLKEYHWSPKDAKIIDAQLIQDMELLETNQQNTAVQVFSLEIKDYVSIYENGVTFHIYLTGCLPEYRYQLRDSLLRENLWSAAQNQNMTDVMFLVNGVDKFYAHKMILAARSPVFASQFERRPIFPTELEIIALDNVDPSDLEQFLRFVYTGEFTSTVNAKLLQLFASYRIESAVKMQDYINQHISAEHLVKIAVLANPASRQVFQETLTV